MTSPVAIELKQLIEMSQNSQIKQKLQQSRTVTGGEKVLMG